MDEDSTLIYEKVLFEDERKQNQTKLTVNLFRGVEYIHLRKYYMDFSEEWCPSNEGVAMPMGISNVSELFKGIAEIMSLAESKETIEEFFGDIIREIYVK
jgi:hypothetical protein